jgi:hypothetical protein
MSENETKPTQAQLRKTLAIDGHVIKYTANNGAHIMSRDRDHLGRVYVLASYRGEWVVWRHYGRGVFQHGRYFGTDHADAYSRFMDLTFRARMASHRRA